MVSCSVVCCGVLRSTVVCDLLWCAVMCGGGGGGSVLWSYDVPCGVLCCHVVWSGVMWCGLVSCGVVWCGGVSGNRVACVGGSRVCWLLGTWGCLAAWVVCWVFGWVGHVVWCVHPVVLGAVCCCVLCDVMSVGTM